MTLQSNNNGYQNIKFFQKSVDTIISVWYYNIVADDN